ncbi:MAG: hypothetical protein K2H33_04600 [Muribaculaceae bacterium]|uniref:hypothetical protein n=1 Tax=uncultured Muribaculum sp. TaxID=1918613 RepID=UPI0023D6B724|nr:hypothetical protein [uncultured Muribaculum sp.]MDE5900619.1 hypothetical protein [Muribaculaceae bacterium]
MENINNQSQHNAGTNNLGMLKDAIERNAAASNTYVCAGKNETTAEILRKVYTFLDELQPMRNIEYLANAVTAYSRQSNVPSYEKENAALALQYAIRTAMAIQSFMPEVMILQGSIEDVMPCVLN